jgi:hypothetical protein
MTNNESSTMHLEVTPRELRELADVLHWAVFQLGYTPREASREELEALAARIGFEALQVAQPASSTDANAALSDYVNVLFDYSDAQAPYQVFVFKNGLQIELVGLPDLASAASLCRQRGLPVLTNDPQVSNGLYAHGIASRPLIK